MTCAYNWFVAANIDIDELQCHSQKKNRTETKTTGRLSLLKQKEELEFIAVFAAVRAAELQILITQTKQNDSSLYTASLCLIQDRSRGGEIH